MLRQLASSVINKCPICSRCIRGQSYQIQCNVCCLSNHVNCISTNPDDWNYLINQVNDCICCECIRLMLPFNNIMDNSKFLAAINHIDKPLSLDASNLIFHPLEINDIDHTSPLCDIDPDLYFYNSIDFQLSSNCNYYDESTFSDNKNYRNECSSKFVVMSSKYQKYAEESVWSCLMHRILEFCFFCDWSFWNLAARRYLRTLWYGKLYDYWKTPRYKIRRRSWFIHKQAATIYRKTRSLLFWWIYGMCYCWNMLW